VNMQFDRQLAFGSQIVAVQQIIHLGACIRISNRSCATNNNTCDGQLAFGSQIVAVQQIIHLMGSLHSDLKSLLCNK
jgi:hypothetical protein